MLESFCVYMLYHDREFSLAPSDQLLFQHVNFISLLLPSVYLFGKCTDKWLSVVTIIHLFFIVPVISRISSLGTGTNTDEFGRDRSKYEETARQRRVAEREGRRNRRRKKRIDNSEHNDGMSSDDEELDAEVAKFNSDRGKQKRKILSFQSPFEVIRYVVSG